MLKFRSKRVSYESKNALAAIWLHFGRFASRDSKVQSLCHRFGCFSLKKDASMGVKNIGAEESWWT